MLNQCQFIGRLGKDPEIRSVGSGDKVANFSLACSERWRDKSSGEQKEKTEWVNVVVWGDGLVRVVEQYVHKGDLLFISGKLQTRKWKDKDNNDRYSTEVVLQGLGGKLTMLGSKNDSGGGGGSRGGGGGRDEGYGSGGGGYGGGGGGSAGDRARESFPQDLDDEIPF